MLFYKPCGVYSWLLIQPALEHTRCSPLFLCVFRLLYSRFSLKWWGFLPVDYHTFMWPDTGSDTDAPNPLLLLKSLFSCLLLCDSLSGSLEKSRHLFNMVPFPVRNPLSSFSSLPNTHVSLHVSWSCVINSAGERCSLECTGLHGGWIDGAMGG